MLDSFRLALSYWSRLRGLLFTKPHAGLLVLCPCRSIHTVGMKYALDVAFVDGTGMVLRSFREVGSAVFLRDRNAKMVLERFASSEPWYVEGERILLGSDGSNEEEELL